MSFLSKVIVIYILYLSNAFSGSEFQSRLVSTFVILKIGTIAYLYTQGSIQLNPQICNSISNKLQHGGQQKFFQQGQANHYMFAQGYENYLYLGVLGKGFLTFHKIILLQLKWAILRTMLKIIYVLVSKDSFFRKKRSIRSRSFLLDRDPKKNGSRSIIGSAIRIDDNQHQTK